MACPKCNAESGDDWSQCEGGCPMPGSPYYRPVVAPQQVGSTDTAHRANVGAYEDWFPDFPPIAEQ